MEKRQFLARIGGVTAAETSSADPAFTRFANSVMPQRGVVPAGLEPYTGAWGKDQAKHLLRRALFGFTQADLNKALAKSASDCVDTLLALPVDAPGPPLATDPLETAVPVGQTWVNSVYDNDLNGHRNVSLRSWWMGLLLGQEFSIREKMTLFWHNHFATESVDVGDARYMYFQNALLRKSALGNFKELAKQISLDAAMLRYLNGNTNTKNNPNENYGRELQELFTIGKGPEIEAGNYTNYTEEDVKAASRVLTGWKDVRDPVGQVFNDKQHDPTDKIFSKAYGNTVIKGRAGASGGALELDDLVAMIFAQPETARYLCRKLYRFFVYYVIDAQTEKDVIQPMADMLRQADYEVKPVVAALLKSAHFFHALNIGCHIKAPLDLVAGTLRQLAVALPDASNLALQYAVWLNFKNEGKNLQQDLFDPPNVAGWSAYYQDPVFYETWISSDTLPRRVQLTDRLSSTAGLSAGGIKITTDVIALAKTTSQPDDAKTLVAELAQFLFPITITANQEKYLKDILLAGLPDYEWDVEWTDHINDPDDASKRKPVDSRLRALLKAMMAMGEYQLC